MNLHATYPVNPHPAVPALRENYRSSSIELRGGATVLELSLGHLQNDEVSELLRMRNVWKGR